MEAVSATFAMTGTGPLRRYGVTLDGGPATGAQYAYRPTNEAGSPRGRLRANTSYQYPGGLKLETRSRSSISPPPRAEPPDFSARFSVGGTGAAPRSTADGFSLFGATTFWFGAAGRSAK
jgi:hypothetical protein